MHIKLTSKIIIFLGLSLVYYYGMLIDVMDVDAAQYANMALSMLSKSDWLQFTDRGYTYLDKPPLLFWLSAISFKMFGVSNFAYKLPTMLSTIIGIWSTYKFSKLYYSENAAFLSAVILASCQAYFLFNNDVRTDALLTNSVIFSYYHLAAYLRFRLKLNFILAFLGISLALMAKGPIGCLAVVLGFGGHLLIQRNFKDIFNWRWLLGIIIIALFLGPMCYGLYTQYGTNGLRFFFWTQSFGRITGESVWENNMGPLFIFHSFLWGFLPWTFLPFVAVFFKIKSWIQNKFQIEPNSEYITFSGMILCYLCLEQSRYELPHYIFLVTPFAAILSGCVLDNFTTKQINLFSKFQIPVLFGLWILGIFLFFYAFWASIFFIFLYTILFILFIVLLLKNDINFKIFYLSCITIITINLFFNIQFYPNVLKYQPASQLKNYITDHHLDDQCIYSLIIEAYSMDFYLGHRPHGLNTIPDLYSFEKGKSYYLVAPNHLYYELFQRWDFKTTRLAKYPLYHVSRLTPKFLNPQTRKEAIDTLHFCRIDL